jgi:hypothetical protein
MFAPIIGADGIHVDELGNGYEVVGLDADTGTIITNNLISNMDFDPSLGVTSRLVLVYDLIGTDYQGATNGDVALVDVNFGGTVSHVLRFWNGQLIFYARDGNALPADSGLPTSLSSNMVQIANLGPAGTAWFPKSGNQPGFVGGYTSSTTPPEKYTFTSLFPFLANPQNPLAITQSGGNVLLSWPTNLSNVGYGLFANDSLATTNWTPVTTTPGATNGLSEVSLQATSTFKLFMLKPTQ